MAITPINLS